jgi:hypothetical protein
MEQPIVVRVRQQIDRVVVRMRTALDLPSRAELVELTRRLEELDRRFAAMAAERVAAMSTAVPALPEAEAEAETETVAVAEAVAVAVAVAETVAETVAEAVVEAAPEPQPQPQHHKKNGKNRRR